MHFCGDKLVSAQLNMGQDNGGCDMDNSDCESTNSTDRRQNRYSPEVLGTTQNPIFPEIYAPTDGFVFTVGINIKPFGREECDDECHKD